MCVRELFLFLHNDYPRQQRVWEEIYRQVDKICFELEGINTRNVGRMISVIGEFFFCSLVSGGRPACLLGRYLGLHLVSGSVSIVDPDLRLDILSFRTEQ